MPDVILRTAAAWAAAATPPPEVGQLAVDTDARTARVADGRRYRGDLPSLVPEAPVGTDTASRPLALADVARVIVNGASAQTIYRVPLSSEVTFLPSSFVYVQGGRFGAVLAYTYLNGFPNPDPVVSGVSTGWGARSNTTVTFSAGNGARATATASGSYGFILDSVALTTLGVSPGDRVSARVQLTLSGDTSVAGLAIRFVGAGQTISELGRADSAGSGVRYNTYQLVPAGTEFIQLVIYATATAAGATLDARQAMVSPAYANAALATYADGTTAGCSWANTAHNSASFGPTIRGERFIPPGGETTLRNLAADVWNAALAGTAPGVLKTTDVLTSDKSNGQPGYRAPDERMAKVNLPLVANRIYASRFLASRDSSVTIIGFNVQTAGSADDRVEVGIYNASGTKVASATSTGRLNSAGYKSVTIASSKLVAGSVYYAAIGTAGSGGAVLTGTDIVPNGFGSAIPLLDAFYIDSTLSTTTTAFPTTLGAVTGQSAAPLFWVRES